MYLSFPYPSAIGMKWAFYIVSIKSYSGLKNKIQMVSTVAKNRVFSLEKRHFCCNGVGNWSMASNKKSPELYGTCTGVLFMLGLVFGLEM